jgi:hypothetical protein
MIRPHFLRCISAIVGMMNTDSTFAAYDETGDAAKSESVGQLRRPKLVRAGLSRLPDERRRDAKSVRRSLEKFARYGRLIYNSF